MGAEHAGRERRTPARALVAGARGAPYHARAAAPPARDFPKRTNQLRNPIERRRGTRPWFAGRSVRGWLRALAAAMPLVSAPAAADPWLAPGDLVLRHDIQLLADAGILDVPVNTWPITWASVARELDGYQAGQEGEVPGPAVVAALERVKAGLQNARGATGLQPSARVAARSEDFWLRTFQDTPRENSEVALGASWMGERFAARLQGWRVSNPPDGDDWRLDGSYVAAVMGNHILSGGAMDRWWGPGRDNTLILSSAARPVWGFSLERNAALAFRNEWLSWIGAWTYSLNWGFLGDEREIPNARLLTFRVASRPTDSLEVGLSRLAIWCGDGRPCDAETLLDIIIGRDNTGESGINEENDPSNQLFAWDLRWVSPFSDGPWALYTQWVANDEVNGRPSQWFGQIGFETWGELETRWLAGSWRAHLELTDTVAEFWQGDPAYNRAYNHYLYQTGVRYKGQPLGASIDGDSLSVSAGVTLVQPDGNSWDGLLRWSNINRRGGDDARDQRHAVSAEELEVLDLHVGHTRQLQLDEFDLGRVSIGVGFQRSSNEFRGGDSDTAVQAFLDWTWDISGR